MKKLLTTMSAVAVAMGLYAADPGALSGTSFEGLTAGDPLDITATTGELTETAGFWRTNGTDTLTVREGTSVAAASAARSSAFSGSLNERYLEVKTASLTNSISRRVNADGSAVDIDGGTSTTKGLYFDSYVRFTAFDEDQTIDLGAGGKLAIWIKEVYGNGDNADPTGTNLVITAGYLDSSLAGVVVTNYNCEVVRGTSFNDGGWHRVTVKAIDNIYSSGTVTPGFVVFIDGNYVYTTDDTTMGISGSLTGTASEWNSLKALFPSACQGVVGAGTIAAVDFAGQGDVDELVFTRTAPFDDAKDIGLFTITVPATGVTSVTFTTNNFDVTITETTTLTITDALKNGGIKIVAQYAEDYMGGTWTGLTADQDGFYWPESDGDAVGVVAKLAGAYVDDTPYGTLAEAVAAANGASSDCTVKLAADADAGITIANANSGVTITLDLAGKDIAVASGNAITLSSGSLYITNSTPADIGVVSSANGNSVKFGVENGGTVALTLAGGQFNNAIDDTDSNGGAFAIVYAEPLVKFAAWAEGYVDAYNEAIVPANTYEIAPLLGSDPLMYSLAEKATTYTVTFVSGIAGQITNSYSLAAGEPTPVVDASIAGKTYVWDPATNATVTGDATYTAVYSDIHYTIKFVYGLNKEATNTVDATYFESVSEPTGTARAGYTLAWTPAVAEWPITVTHDETYEATYTPIEYTITYKDNEGNLFTAQDWADGYTAPTSFTVTAPATLPVAANIARDGVTFNGWTNSVGTTIAATTAGIYENLEVFADFTVLGPTYPSYIDTSDAKVKGQYDDWATANNVPAGANNYEADFLLNVAPGLVGATLEATAVSISGTTVTIDINHAVNGYAYVKKADTVAGLATATPIAIEITPADRVQGLDNGARIELTGESGAAQFYQIGVQSAPVAVPNAD